MTAATFLPAPQRPPHDPLWMSLGGCKSWSPAAAGASVEITPDGCELRLVPAPGAARLLSEASGSLGGLVPPRNVAVDCEGFIWLLAAADGVLKRFDPCACAFVTVPCTGGVGAGPRQLVRPAGIAVEDASLFICDAGPPGRLLVFDRRSFALRAVWTPPAGATPQPWRPEAVLVDAGRVFVADPNNGLVHMFARWGGWLGAIPGLGAVTALAMDCAHRLYVVTPGLPQVIRFFPPGGAWEAFARPADVAEAFPEPPFPVSREGIIDLRGLCPEAGGHDLNGLPAPLPPEPSPAFVAVGEWRSRALDSGIAGCVWHRAILDSALGAHGRVRLATLTAETLLPESHVALPDAPWVDVPLQAPGDDALILSPPGRYLWLRLTLSGDGAESPRVCGLALEYPRISLARYLPAAFAADPIAADFTDRLLAVFDRGFRDLETRIDDGAALFDPCAAPATKASDVLGWLGGWLGLVLERGWPEARRRAVLKAAGKLFACRGTPQGLWRSLLLWLGWDRFAGTSGTPDCGPRCRPGWTPPQPPPLVLEHWRLRRWLWLGKGRLGSDTELWGETILKRSQLDSTAQLGVTKLDTTANPLLDPFNRDANRFSVFLPARLGADSRERGWIARLIEDHRPAQAAAQIIYVHPRMRIGVQASIGFDSVVGCWPSGVTLDEARLGRATVLPSGNPGGPQARIGKTARLTAGKPPALTRQGRPASA